ncbi:winged helix-turn-helix domain-containing protein [Pseudonocardia acaciae]|uniref:winged helix-turn-helix domain-containing protein n=1 Tax=Pseudonocardia acaciae TaxID=551276 RepID=UPI00068401A1|nr:response regulator transcription factor [Pseudonocardia acaciae]
MQQPRALTFRRYRVLLAVPADRSTGPLLRTLRSHGYDATVMHDGTRVLDTVQSGRFAAVVLEVGLPGLDTAAVLAGLARLASDTPVIALTPREQRDQVLAGLRGGQDDYLLTPFSVDELIARLRLRMREEQPAERAVARRGDITVDTALGLVSVDGQLVTLTPTEFALLTILISHPDQAMSREKLTTMLWRDPPSSNVVEVYIGYLRRKLGSDRIRTVRGVGYVLEE